MTEYLLLIEFHSFLIPQKYLSGKKAPERFKASWKKFTCVFDQSLPANSTWLGINDT